MIKKMSIGSKAHLAVFATIILLFCAACSSAKKNEDPIDRKALVQRHTIKIDAIDSLDALSLGNGRFAFTVDATGLQTFPATYAKGISLGTQSEWGWHSFPNTENYQLEEVYKYYDQDGRKVPYSVQGKIGRAKGAADYLRENVHRLQLGTIGFSIQKQDGSLAEVQDIKDIEQTLDMWTGTIQSRFTVDGKTVEVTTLAHQQNDAIGVSVKSALVKEGRLKIRIRFPFPTAKWSDEGNNWESPEKHQSAILKQAAGSALLEHKLDTTRYGLAINWNGGATVAESTAHDFLLSPDAQSDSLQCAFQFEEKPVGNAVPNYSAIKENSQTQWPMFWQSGGAIDFTGSTDDRATELERRIILSQYLTKIQCAGNQPPQETGLTYNSWYGKPHLEMHWWHGVHFALWNRANILEKSMSWYRNAAPDAYEIAKRQGYEGLRWQKMTDHIGRETPSSVGAMLIWQQPHYIYFAELLRRQTPGAETINKYKDLVFATADFMADFAYYDSAKDRYILGPGLIPAQERFKAEETFNPAYELVYWQWALKVAASWKKELGEEPSKKWQDVLAKLSPLPMIDTVYSPAESALDAYTNPVYRTDHPSVLGALGMMPLMPGTDTVTMRKTFNWVWDNWAWHDTWGWDFPMVAMTATRLNMPDKAIDALLMPIKTNTYITNGHNYQDDRLRIYLPGNGGLLIAAAMMCAGYDGATRTNPGFPDNGKWKVKWEGLKPMP